MLARRDNARTQWIAGVSHDVRTPLALIMGWAEQLERDAETPAASRRKATGIRTQCEKLRTLIDDLNLTSKLEYGAQPLRRKSLRAGPLFRALVAQFCENAQEKKCEIALEQSEQSEQAMLCADRALLERLLENLLNNSIRHNPGRVSITVRTEVAGGCFCLTVADDGCGYPPAVLAAMNAPKPCENAPHILGLHVVEQIAIAHGGKAEFAQNIPQGAKAVISLPME
jgi:phosphate regulon sensor protein phoR